MEHAGVTVVKRAFTILSIILLSLGYFSRSADALTLDAGEDGLCLATLTGRIEPGDLAQIAGLDLVPPENWTLPEDGRWKTLCLNSSGGDFRESLNIARHVTSHQIGTAIAKGEACTGSCALIFMFGTASQGPYSGQSWRVLHAKGRLAFETPILSPHTATSFNDTGPQDAGPQDSGLKDSDPQNAERSLVQTMLFFHALAARMRPDVARPTLDADLVEAIRNLGPDESLVIDTVNQAGRWGIEVIGFQAPALTDRAFFHACQNLTIWPDRLAGGQVPFERNDAVFELSVSGWTAGGAVRDRYDLQFASRDVFECAATLAAQGQEEALPLICGFRGEADTGIGPSDCDDPHLLYLWAPIPPLAMVPANTPLAELADGAALPREDMTLTRPTPCQSEAGKARVINVNTFTSLRRAASTDSPKIDELPKGAVFDVPRVPTPDRGHADHANCAALCAAAGTQGTYDRAALGACIDENWMWFRITGPQGKEGFASAKYLEF